MPGLQSFCIYAVISIVAVFLLQITFFVACFALDQKRLEDRRNGFFVWIKYSSSEFKPSEWSQQSYFQTVFDAFFSKIVFKPLGKVGQCYDLLMTKGIDNTIALFPLQAIVILIALGSFGVSIYGNVLLKQEFGKLLVSCCSRKLLILIKSFLIPQTRFGSFPIRVILQCICQKGKQCILGLETLLLS